MKVRVLAVLAVMMVCLGCVPLANASLIVVNFDNIAAPCCGGNGLDPWMTFGMMRIDGGMVIRDSNATTAPNVYANFNVSSPNNSSMPGRIVMMFSSPVSDVGFDIINGSAASSITAYAFDSHGNPIGVDTINLNCSTCSGAVGHVWFDLAGISEVEMRSSRPTSFMGFAVDTVKFSAVPEPGSLLLLGGGLVALWSQRKRFFRN